MRVERRSRSCVALVICAALTLARGAEPVAEVPDVVGAENRVTADSAAWRQLGDSVRAQKHLVADFEERRIFPFRREAVVLRGAVRVSAERGLSLHYTLPEERTVVVDDHGIVVRDASGQKSGPDDPRAAAANEAFRWVLAFDFAALAEKFEVYGRREGDRWTLGLVPRDAALGKAIGDIFVTGLGANVRQIAIRKSVKQHIDIVIDPPRSVAEFSEDEVRRYFR